jgi:hypothetical protein
MTGVLDGKPSAENRESLTDRPEALPARLIRRRLSVCLPS